MEFGIVINQFTSRWQHVEAEARMAEAVGLDSIWLVDHLLPTTPGGDILEAWTALSYLAGITQRVRLGHLVNCVAFRNPGLLAKMAATLDRASGGRLELGLGAGWFEREYDAFGYEFGSPGERRRYFEEYLDVLLLLLTTEGPVDYQGRYLTLDAAECRPAPVQEPHPPIVIGTAGRLMRELTGRKADAWNCPARLLPDLVEKRAVVMAAAGNRTVRTTVQIPVAVGRTREEAETARSLPHLAWMGDVDAIGIVGTVDEAAVRVEEYRAKGVDGFIGVVPGSRARPGFIEAYGELASRF